MRGVVKAGNRIVFIFVRFIRNSGFLKEREYSSLCVLFVKTVCVDVDLSSMSAREKRGKLHF